MYKNPNTYPLGSAILSKLLSILDENEVENIMTLIKNKFSSISNSGFLETWLQRVIIKIDRYTEFNEKLCRKVNDDSVEIWNSSWLVPLLKNIVDTTSIIDESVINEIDNVIGKEEVELFKKVDIDYIIS